MKKVDVWLTLLFFLSLCTLTGCNLDFEAKSVVSADGSMVRTTRYMAENDSDKEEIEKYYDLIPGGTWKIETAKKFDWATQQEKEGNIHVYELSKKYKYGQKIPADYFRKGEISSRISKNEIQLQTRNYIFAKVFIYEERFPATANMRETELGLRQFYAQYIEQCAKNLSEEFKGKVSMDQAKQKLDETFNPLLEKIIEVFQKEGLSIFDNKTIESELKQEAIVAKIVNAFPSPLPEEAEAWNESVKRALEKTDESIENYWSTPEVVEKVFGIYGYPIFQSYSFKIMLSLPGKVIESNATERKGSVLSWKFDVDDFRWEDFILRARSRLICTDRIILAVITLIVVGSGFIILRKKKVSK